MENHEYGLPPDHYRRWPVLARWYDVLTTTRDRNGCAVLPCGGRGRGSGFATGEAVTAARLHTTTNRSNLFSQYRIDTTKTNIPTTQQPRVRVDGGGQALPLHRHAVAPREADER